MIGKPRRARVLAFYLPQFHPIPENDAWWGPGFTEWTNVAGAKALFMGHYQPHIPGDLGFYDLRLPESRWAQAELAKAHGIEGFCYWHYWLGGKRLLDRPFAEVLASGEPDLPFCLAWANETWSRRWLGEERDVLCAQTYSAEDDRRHARWLLPVFGDPRCFRVAGRPLFLIYRPHDLPEPGRTLDVLKDAALKEGLPEPFVLGINAHCAWLDCRSLGFDGTLNFEPQLGVLPDFLADGRSPFKLRRNLGLGITSSRLKVYDDRDARRRMGERQFGFPVRPCVYVGWDNTPRRGRDGIIIHNSTPATFAESLERALRSVAGADLDDRLVFLNAWNEWAEGNHLEPDLKHQLGYLSAVQRLVLA
jgi:hypothetical protein